MERCENARDHKPCSPNHDRVLDHAQASVMHCLSVECIHPTGLPCLAQGLGPGANYGFRVKKGVQGERPST